MSLLRTFDISEWLATLWLDIMAWGYNKIVKTVRVENAISAVRFQKHKQQILWLITYSNNTKVNEKKIIK